LVVFHVTALTITLLCIVAVWPVSIWLSALRQPARHRAAPKCHTPSPCGCPSCGGQCTGVVASHHTGGQSTARSHGRRPSLPAFSKLGLHFNSCKNQVSNEHSAWRRPERFRAGQVSVLEAELPEICKGSRRAKFHRSPAVQGSFWLIQLPLRAPA
jgi:hypothetical protein